MVGAGFLQSLLEKPIWDVWPNLDPMDSCVLAHSVHGVECARDERAARRALFLFDSEGAGDGAG